MERALTKIVATLGPASSAPNRIKDLAEAGANVFRLNFSHGDAETQAKTFRSIRQLSKKNKTYYGILCDLQGPKLRIGSFKAGHVVLKARQTFHLDMDAVPGDKMRVQLPHAEVYQVAKKDMILLLNDGQIQLRVTRVYSDKIITKVVVGGILSDKKGVNIPGVVLPIDAMTVKDKKDLKQALKLGADWICLSFVQTPADVEQAHALIKGRAGIIVKIEKPSALQHLKQIVALADGVMVARGDLGVECPVESVPVLQRKIVEECQIQGKPVIVATQMLESMINAPVPTRAEVSDIAMALYEGVDAIMLSGETAVGQYPTKAVAMMRRVILQTQQDPNYVKHMSIAIRPQDNSIAGAITSSVYQLANVLENPACVVSYSISGSTTLRIARERILLPILGMCTKASIASKLNLVWGVFPVVAKEYTNISMIVSTALEHAKKEEMAKDGQELIITAGIPMAEKGNTNLIHVTKMV